MRKKIGIVLIILALIILGVLIYTNVSVETEYTPEPEIKESEYRNTTVSLYFQDKETKNLQVETRLIDSKELLENPYIKLISLLLEGPDNSNLESAIPQGTKLNSVVQEGEKLIIDVSDEFILSEENSNQQSNAIYSIVNTVTELKEVSCVKILINGKEQEGFYDVFARVK